MSSEEFRAVVEIAMRDGLHFPWWSYILAVLLPMGGAYFGAYLKRKAEDHATQENFNQLREQLRKTTLDTEEIKVTLSRKNWLTQQQWSFRERYYMRLLTHLTKLRLSLKDRNSCYSQPDAPYNKDLTEGKHFQRLEQVGLESYQQIRELIGPASVFLSPGTIGSLEHLIQRDWEAAEFCSGKGDYLEEALKLVEEAQLAVLAEARNELTQPQPGT